MEKIFDIAKDSEKSWGVIAQGIDGNFEEVGKAIDDTMKTKEIVENIKYEGVFEDGYIKPNGETSASDTYKKTQKISVKSGDIVYASKTPVESGVGGATMRFLTAFSGDEIITNSGGESIHTYTVKEGEDSIIVSFLAALYTQGNTIFINRNGVLYEVKGLDDLHDEIVVVDEKCEIVRQSFDEGYLDYYESPVLIPENGYYARNGRVSGSTFTTLLHSKVGIPSGAITAKFENIQAFSDGKVIVNFFVDGVWSRDVIAETDGKLLSYEIEIPEGVSHIGFNYRNTDHPKLTFHIYKKSALLKVDCIKDDSITPQKLTFSDNILRGKKWAVIGDSFTLGAGVGTFEDGIYEGENKSYPYIIGRRNEMDIQRLFEGGRTICTPRPKEAELDWSYNASRNYLTYEGEDRPLALYKQIAEDVDYITLYIGINDTHLIGIGDDDESYGVNVTADKGTIDSTEITSFYGAWNTVLNWLITNRPFAHIGIIVSNGLGRDEYRQAEIEIANKWGVPYIDLNGDERTPMMLRSTNPAICDAAKGARLNAQRISSTSQHPNSDAYEYESTFIEQFLRTL